MQVVQIQAGVPMGRTRLLDPANCGSQVVQSGDGQIALDQEDARRWPFRVHANDVRNCGDARRPCFHATLMPWVAPVPQSVLAGAASRESSTERFEAFPEGARGTSEERGPAARPCLLRWQTRVADVFGQAMVHSSRGACLAASRRRLAHLEDHGICSDRGLSSR